MVRVKSKFEILTEETHKENIDIVTADLPGNILGLYYNEDSALIALNNCLKTKTEQACVLAEELGHHFTSSGDLLTDQNIDNTIVRQQETRAKRWAYKKLIPFDEIIEAYEAGCQTLYEFAEYLEVTEGFLRCALKQYAAMYGVSKRYGNYIIYFDPPAMLKLLE